MNEKALRVLEFNKIKDKLSSYAVSPMGKELAQKLEPMHYLEDIRSAQEETTAAASMILRKGNLPLGGLTEVRPQLKRVSVGGVLNCKELITIGNFLYVCTKVKSYGKKESKDDNYSVIDGLFELVQPVPELERAINTCILSDTEIADDATPKLRDIRREIKRSNDKIRDSLNSVINSPAYKNMLQDNVITIRNDRYCVPVKLEYKGSFAGMVHDQSNSGSTVFIEPASVVALNNKIRELKSEEQAEMDRILAWLSDMAGNNLNTINADLEILTRLDFIFAKGELSLSMEGSKPEFNKNGIIDIRRGRHPLLNRDEVVPIDINLGGDFSALLITGPNTGGKTVALKTLGLFSVMGQSGLHIPAGDNSRLSMFSEVFADIGDEQSIEQSLSTFSAHMSNIVTILDRADENCLVLLDELGAGTDPTEGAALAIAIISYLMERKTKIAVTTHYSELKVFALETDGIENASCEFDIDTLRPTYKLLIGVPGKSNAFAISKRLGLSDNIIDKAKEVINKEAVRFEDVLTELEMYRKTVETEKEKAEEYRQQTEDLKKNLERQKDITNRQKERILREAKEEAREIIKSAKEESDRLVKEINKEARQKGNRERLNAARSELKGRLEEANSQVARPVFTGSKEPLTDAKAGDRVYITSFGQSGVVMSPPDSSGDVFVQTGMMKMKVPLRDLVKDVERKEKDDNAGRVVTKVKSGKAQKISTEIDCRGQLVDEGIGNIDKYLDDAYLAGLKKVTIIHGKGTGALRSAVQQYLRTNPHVKSFRYGMYGEGETGVTIVELK